MNPSFLGECFVTEILPLRRRSALNELLSPPYTPLFYLDLAESYWHSSPVTISSSWVGYNTWFFLILQLGASLKAHIKALESQFSPLRGAINLRWSSCRWTTHHRASSNCKLLIHQISSLINQTRSTRVCVSEIHPVPTRCCKVHKE